MRGERSRRGRQKVLDGGSKMTVGESSLSVGDGLRIASQAICYVPFFAGGRVTAQQRPIVNTFLHLSVPSPYCAAAKDIGDKRWAES